MFLCSINMSDYLVPNNEKSVVLTLSPKQTIRKVMCSPGSHPFLIYAKAQGKRKCLHFHLSLHANRRNSHSMFCRIQKPDTGTFFFAPLKGALTVEAALVLPLFLFFMIGVLQYGRCMETAVQFGSAMAETGKSMAVTAYVSRYGSETGSTAKVAAGALSAAYAQQQVMSKTADTASVKNANMLLSSFLEEEEMINLVLTYQIKTPFGAVKLPGNFFVQCAKVRAWTGRAVSSGSGEEEDGEGSSDYVYVTVTGTVYHEDPDCTHLKLSIREVSAAELGTLRNNNGGIYHSCERCGNSGSSTVYITDEGTRYHSSLSCSGLKRTVTKVSKEEAGQMKSCSKCGTH